MLFTLLSHQWKAFWRSRSAGKSLALQLLFGFMILYLLACCLVLGIGLKFFLHRLFPGQDVIKVFCGLILYYFAFDIVFRFLFQDLPVLTVEPYLAQDIRRRQLVSFLNIRSIFNFLNLLPIFIFCPFTITAIAPVYGGGAAAAFIISILALTGWNHFILLYIKRKTIVSIRWMIGFVTAIVLFIALDYFKILPIREGSAFLFQQLLAKPWLALAAILLAALAFINNQHFLLRNLYIEEISRRGGKKQSADYTWLQQWGSVGELMALDIKLMFRNKRPRSTIFASAMILLYGFILYTPRNLHPGSYGMLLFAGFFITGVFIFNYGRFAFAWQSQHFDGLLSAYVSPEDYIRSKITLLTLISTAFFILSSPYGFIDWRLLPIQAAAYLYNIGVTTVLTIYFATYSYKAIDLNRSAFLNYQGMAGTDMLYTVAMMLIPFVIYMPLALLAGPWVGIAAVGGVGIIGLVLRGWIMRLLVVEFYKRKHLILQGFREK